MIKSFPNSDLRTRFFEFGNECCATHSEERFHDRLYPRLMNLLPHKMFGGFVGTMYDDLFLHITLGFPPGLASSFLSPNGQLTPPMLEQWKKIMKPIFLDLSALPKTVRANPFSVVLKHDIRNIVTHGQADSTRSSFCYFVFVGVDFDHQEHQCGGLLELITPHLYSAFSRISYGNSVYQLSKREEEVIFWISKGRSSEAIGKILSISVTTVKTHVKNIMCKLESDTRSQAVAKAHAHGLIQQFR